MPFLDKSLPYTCAPWIKNRKVLFMDLATMDLYYSRKKDIYRGGEYYMSASLDYALRENGFTVEWHSVTSICNNRGGLATIAKNYHRIFANGIAPWEELQVSDTLSWSNMCKCCSFHWWENIKAPPSETVPFDHRQFLKPYPTADFYNTYLGYFPHSVLLRTEYPSPARAKVGVLLGKTPGKFKAPAFQRVIQALLDNGFELHTTCNDCSNSVLPSTVV